ncbi:MAG: hypothetical protein M3545_16010, partial [Acidobacteriota bacterium]|nr:hypothetical protein [Acidobacteriota bacterium]
MTFEAVVERFEARRHGAGFMAKCPTHDDGTASLSLTPGADGRTLLKCHAGCALDAILGAVQLKPRDLFPEKTTTQAQIVATYDYRAETGELLFQSVRFPTITGGKKDFRQRRPDGAGGWAWKLEGVRRVLFGLPELQHQAVVYMPEGEKDVLAVRALGLVATTNPAGAGKWKNEYTGQLVTAGVQSVVVLPDNDDP